MEFKLHVCDVCKLLDNDFTIKECFFCDGCQAWICKQDKNKIGRRSKAMLLRKARQYGMALIILAGLLTGKSEAQYYARTDTNTVQLPTYPPNLGHLVGAGMRAVDQQFHTELIRATDVNTDSPNNSNASYLTSASAQQQIWFKDNKRLIVTKNGGQRFIINFNPTTKAVSVLKDFIFTGSYTPSRKVNNVMYVAKGTSLMQYLFPLDIQGKPVATLLFDFAQCLPLGFDPYWQSNLYVDNTDNNFLISYSEGTQNTGMHVLYFRRGKGCRVWNTSTGMVSGQWGPFGVINNAVRFSTVHAVSLSKNGLWAVVEKEACDDPDQCPHSPVFWNAPSTTVNIPQNNLGGHFDTGFTDWLNSAQQIMWVTRKFNNPTVVNKIPLANPPAGITVPFGKHTSWTNVDALDTRPFMWTVASITSPFPAAWYNEIDISKIDGSVTWRISHTFSNPFNQRFATAQAIANISIDGKYAALSTDMMSSFGSESGNVNCTPNMDCRGDVVIVNLGTAGKVLK